MIVSGEQQRDSARHNICYLFSPEFPPPQSRLPHNIEQSSLCYTVGLCWLFILSIATCICPSQLPVSSSYPSPPAIISLFSKFVSLFQFCFWSHPSSFLSRFFISYCWTLLLSWILSLIWVFICRLTLLPTSLPCHSTLLPFNCGHNTCLLLSLLLDYTLLGECGFDYLEGVVLFHRWKSLLILI